MINVDMNIPQGRAIESEDQLPKGSFMENLSDAWSASLGQFELASQFNSKHRAYNKGFDEALQKIKAEDSDNEAFYDSYNNTTNVHKRIFEELYDSGKISLEDGEIKASGGKAKSYAIEKKDAMKGFLLAINKGLNTQEVRGKVELDVGQQYQEFEKALERTEGVGGALGSIAGTMVGAIKDPFFLATLPLGSAAVGKGMAVNALKAFGQEFAIGSATELVIQGGNYNFKQNSGIDYDLTDLATDTLLAGGAGGVLRAGGSLAIDTNILRKANWDKATFDRFERITYGTNTNKQVDTLDALNKVYEDKTVGKEVSVERITDDNPTMVEEGSYADVELGGKSMYAKADESFPQLEMPDEKVVQEIEQIGYNIPEVAEEMKLLDEELMNIEKGMAECLS